MSDLVEFRHLKYIAAVADAGNFTRAAERLFLSQPSLSKQIRDIENDIGFQIFVRTPEGVFPTPVGQLIVDYAASTLRSRSCVLTMAKQIFLGNVPPLRMGFSSFVNSRQLQSFRAGYTRHFPNCVLQLSGGDTVHVLQRMERGDLDCAVLPLPINGPDWNVRIISSTPLVVCMRVDDPLTERSSVTLSELAERLTIFRDPEGHPSAHARLIQMFSEAGIEMHVSSSAATPHDIQLLVRDGFGLALVSEDSLLETDITTRPIAGVSWTADTAFVSHKDNTHPAVPFIESYMLGNDKRSHKKPSKPERSQLPLKFDLLAEASL